MPYIRHVRKEKKDKHFVHKPTYPGGRQAISKFISENMKYPKEALEKRIEGTVSMKYTINHKGIVTDTQLISGIGHGCDEEADRLVRLLKFDVPANRKMRVTFHKNIHVHFKLPKVQTQPKTVLRYSVISQKSESEQNAGKSYHYTVGIPQKPTEK